jgi:hypothetical protein
MARAFICDLDGFITVASPAMPGRHPQRTAQPILAHGAVGKLTAQKVCKRIVVGAPTSVSGPPGAAITTKENTIMNTNVNPDPATVTSAPNVATTVARPKPRGKRAALAAALLVSGGLTLSGLGLAATAQAAPGPAPQAASFSDCWWGGGWDHHHHHHHWW